jgi:hypothetical protein
MHQEGHSSPQTQLGFRLAADVAPLSDVDLTRLPYQPSHGNRLTKQPQQTNRQADSPNHNQER